MRYLCLIYWNEDEFDALPPAKMSALNAAHLALNEGLRRSGQLIEAEALAAPRESACVRVRKGKVSITDGPFTEAKEVVAGFYLLEARDMEEAVRIASTLPSAEHSTMEVRPIRTLVVEGEKGAEELPRRAR